MMATSGTPSTKRPERFQAPRGMRDLLPDDMKYWRFLIDTANSLARRYGYQEIEIPAVEQTDLFVRGIGDGTDIVDKELYAFETAGGDKLSLRPEFTAGLVRAFLQDGMESWPQPVKLFTSGPVFRHDRPQAGRYRQLYQFDIEVLGDGHVAMDAQIIQYSWDVFKALGLKDIVVRLNSIGDVEDRKAYIELLQQHYKQKEKELCKNCARRLKDAPLRLLDCKEKKCEEMSQFAPQILDHLSEESYEHFKQLLEIMDELEIPYILDPTLVRGLDYYNRTVFEFVSNAGKSALSLGGGGRYDYLIGQLGSKKDVPAVGVGLGMDRLVEEMQRQEVKLPAPSEETLYMIQLGGKGRKRAMSLFGELVEAGYAIRESFGKESLSAQLRAANKMGVDYSLIVGQQEAIDNTVIIRDMKHETQETVDAGKILVELDKRIEQRTKEQL